jgi:hypothetical protein
VLVVVLCEVCVVISVSMCLAKLSVARMLATFNPLDLALLVHAWSRLTVSEKERAEEPVEEEGWWQCPID